MKGKLRLRKYIGVNKKEFALVCALSNIPEKNLKSPCPLTETLFSKGMSYLGKHIYKMTKYFEIKEERFDNDTNSKC